MFLFWFVVQLLLAVKQCHEQNICHGELCLFTGAFSCYHLMLIWNFTGDIKCENVLVTSWNWLYLADFASFKPTYIPYDDPSDFSFFFDTGGRRLCYLAPEVNFISSLMLFYFKALVFYFYFLAY